ncbi:hypothetical protein HAX54_016030 [Datura stramonium]|uniref:Uncharacterized protein n=1 Tax=Datura stramonium TaxID=4076 RepID=A0ABS8S086_DATST|nr:hypothetical protein [Datura stramonium]
MGNELKERGATDSVGGHAQGAILSIVAVLTASLPQDSVHLITSKQSSWEASQQLLLGINPFHTANGKVPAIQTALLIGNNFIGAIPAMLANCSQLDTILLNDNRFSGSIPPEIFKSSKILKLDLGPNRLNGTIPFRGPLPTSVLVLTSLRASYSSESLLRNNFNGSISEKIGDCHQINYIDLSVNKLSGQIPKSVGDLKNLKSSLYDNMLSGSLPAELEICTSLNKRAEGASFYEKPIDRKIPHGITNMTKLAFLSLAHNNLTGEVPPDLGKNNFPGLVKVDLGYNIFSGQIPSELCNGNKLAVLTLENNHFNGSFPTNIAKCKSVYRVNLLNNHLEGNIPDDIEKNENISFLNVRGNMLAGRIPAAFAYWTNLSTIDLSENMLSYSIPAEFGKLQNLVRLSISSNRLTGQIPLQLSYSAKLAELDLSNNDLSGRIPKEIASSSVLTNLLLQDNKLSGSLPDTFSSSQKLVKLQLGTTCSRPNSMQSE